MLTADSVEGVEIVETACVCGYKPGDPGGHADWRPNK